MSVVHGRHGNYNLIVRAEGPLIQCASYQTLGSPFVSSAMFVLEPKDAKNRDLQDLHGLRVTGRQGKVSGGGVNDR